MAKKKQQKPQSQPEKVSKAKVLCESNTYIPGFGLLKVGDEITAEAIEAKNRWKRICNPIKNDRTAQSSNQQEAKN